MSRRSRSRVRRSRFPRVTADIVKNDCRLAKAIDDLLRHDPTYEQITRKIVRAQERMQKLATPEGWLAYLDLEDHTNWRFTNALALVARWAFRQGQHRRSPRKR